MLYCIMNVLPRSPVFVLQSSFLSHLQRLDFAPRRRVHGCLQLKFSKPNNDVKKLMGVKNIVEAHSTGFEAEECGKEKLLIDCGPDQTCAVGAIVALGKFDALHVGHRALAVEASKMGSPVLLSFTGMAEVLQWEKRLPIVAPCDRKRVMSLWAEVCGGIPPREYHLEFAKVRHLSPRDFVEKLAKELHVKGVVAGANYRFGYKAAGDASDLAQLCGEFGLQCFIVDPVMDESEKSGRSFKDFEGENMREKGQVSSTRVRKALGIGDMKRVTKLLGRDHRLVLTIGACSIEANTACAPISHALNQVPADGVYSSRVYLKVDEIAEVDDECVGGAEVKINDAQVCVTLHEGSFKTFLKTQRYLGLDFQN